MNNQLSLLIKDYQETVFAAVVLLQRSGIYIPSSSFAWIEADMPYTGELNGGGQYVKHGAGCIVSVDSREVDFDFGDMGEVGGFNAWWLTKYAGDRLADYGFSSETEVDNCIKHELHAGKLAYSSDGLYYVAGLPRTYAVDIDCRHPGDMLPSRNQDRVFVLHSHYFQAADLMLENYEKLSKKWEKADRLSQCEKVNQRIYLSSWLGFLGVTCEGFRHLNMRLLLQNERPKHFKELIPIADDIGRLMKKHSDSLREFRNNVFHLRKNTEMVRQFFDHHSERLPWAHELHKALAGFFSKYRIQCEVHYFMHNRKGESELIKDSPLRKRRSL